MATHFTDFSEYTADAQPSDWTERWNTADGAALVRNSGIPGTPSTGGSHALEVTKTATNQYALSWDDVGTPTGDVEVLTLAYLEHTADVLGITVTLHSAGTGGSEDAYVFFLRPFDANEVSLWKQDAGSFTALGDADEGLTRNQWIWIRLQRTSTTIRVRAWADGTSEPGTWSVSTTESTFSSGWVGLGHNNTDGTCWFAQIGVGTGGDEAPSGPLAPEITTTSLPNAQRDTAYSETLAAIGGQTPYTWAITVGTLPSGLSLSSSTGEISGTPDTEESQTFTVQVTDDNSDTDTQELTITVVVTGTGTIYRRQDASNYWRVRLDSGTAYLEKVDAGTLSLVDSAAATFTADSKPKVLASGSRHRVYIDDVLVLDATDSHLSDATGVGLYSEDDTTVGVESIYVYRA